MKQLVRVSDLVQYIDEALWNWIMPLDFSHLFEVDWPSRIVRTEIPGLHGSFSRVSMDKKKTLIVPDQEAIP